MQSLREIIRFSSHVLVSRVSGYVALTSDLFVAGRMLGEAVVGVYSFANTLANIPMEKVTALASRVMPAFYSSIQTDPIAVRRYLLLLTEGVSLITFPVGVGVSFVAEDGVGMLLGEKWLGVIAPLKVLACWAVVRSVFTLITPILYVTGGTRLAMYNSLLCALLYPLGFLLGTRWGSVGLALAWIVLQPPSWVPVYYHVLRAIGLPFWTYLGGSPSGSYRDGEYGRRNLSLSECYPSRHSSLCARDRRGGMRRCRIHRSRHVALPRSPESICRTDSECLRGSLRSSYAQGSENKCPGYVGAELKMRCLPWFHGGG